MQVILTSVLLGISSIGVVGLFIATYSLSKNANRSDIYIFSLNILLITVFLGILFSKILSSSINYLTNMLNSIPLMIYAIISFIIGLILLYWFLIRIVNVKVIDESEKKKENFFIKFIKKDLFLASILFSIFIITDPTFFGVVTITSISDNYILDILSYIIWIVLSELPLYVFVVCMILNVDKKLIDWYQERIGTNKNIKKIKKILNILLSIVIYLGSTYFLLQAMHYFIKGSWFF